MHWWRKRSEIIGLVFSLDLKVLSSSVIRLFTLDFSTDKKYLIWNYFFITAHCRGILQIQRWQIQVSDKTDGNYFFMKELDKLSKMLPSETEAVQEKNWNNCQPDCPLSFLIMSFWNFMPVPHETISLITINWCVKLNYWQASKNLQDFNWRSF